MTFVGRKRGTTILPWCRAECSWNDPNVPIAFNVAMQGVFLVV